MLDDRREGKELSISIRALCEDDWKDVRDLRLEALRSEPGVFSMSYADEVTRSEDEWRALVRNDDDRLRVFGLFAGDELIGLTGVFTDRNDPSGQTAVLGMSYIAPPYRGRGLSRLFYEARLAWARANTTFRKVRVSHRRSNDASGRANRRYGFVQLGVVERVWPDGSNDDEIHYELDLR